MLRSELSFGSYLSYSPRGEGELAAASRRTCYKLKQDVAVGSPPAPLSRLVVNRLRERLSGLAIAELFGADVTVVPVPRSQLATRASLWVPLNVAMALRASGLCGHLSTCLRRARSLRKSSTSAASVRPKPAEHVASLVVDADLLVTRRILLVDDVVTRGATLLAAASVLSVAFPSAEIRAFAVIRTLSDPASFRALEDPCLGTITYRPETEDTQRRP